jgi:hypothetical protein
MTLTGRAVLHRLDMRLRFGRFVRIALAAAISTTVVLGLRQLGVNVIGLMIGASLAQLVGLFTLGALHPAELRAVLRRDPLNAF